MTQQRKIKVVIGKVGLDGHDRGAKVIVRALREAGMEAVYTGIRQTPEAIAEAASREGADAVGLSSLSGAHMEMFPRVAKELKLRGMEDAVLFGGGVIPEEDAAALKKIGFRAIFGSGSSMGEIVEWVRREVAARRGD